MTVRIMAGNYISFTIAADLIRLHMPGVKKCRVTRASACHHTLNDNHWHRLLEIPAMIGVKSNITTFNYVSGLCEQYVKSLGQTPSGFDFLFRMRSRALGQ